jgi:hypothetical protein
MFFGTSMAEVQACMATMGGDQETAQAYMTIANAQKAQGPQTPEQEAAAKDAYAYVAKRDEIADKFKIDDKSKGPGKGNVVSTTEFNKIARTLARAENGQGDLDTSNKAQEQVVNEIPEGKAWVMGMTEEQARAENERRRTAVAADNAAQKTAVNKDMVEVMTTEAGRKLVYKLADNKDARTGEHRKTTIESDAHIGFEATKAFGEGPDGQRSSGYGGNASASYQTGDSRQLFSGLAQSMHITSGSAQEGRLGSSYGGNRRFDKNGVFDFDPDSNKKIAEKDKGMDREQAAVQGVYGYGTTIDGEKITLNQYDKERRANQK